LAITDTNLRGLVRFAAATALAAEILSESTGGDNLLDRTDVVGTGCDATSCALDLSATCSPGTNIVGGAAAVDINDTSQTLAGSQDLAMLKSAISGMLTGLSELGASGKFSAGAGNFADQISLVDPVTEDGDCFRYTLGTLSVGAVPQ
jgi:hypothetical protein